MLLLSQGDEWPTIACISLPIFFVKSKVTESIYVYPTKKVDGSSPEPINLGFSLLSIMQQCLPDANFKSTGTPKTSTDCKEC